MLNLNGIYKAVGNIGFRSKGKLANKPSYFSVGGFSIPVDIGLGKKYTFIFDWVESYGDATLMEDSTYEMDFTLRNLDLEFINDSLDCKKDLDLLNILSSIETVQMEEIQYCWDKVLEDGTIEPDARHFFDVSYFEIDVFYMEDGEDMLKTFRVPLDLLNAYNKETDKQWNDFNLAMDSYCIREEAGSILLRN